MAGGGHTIRQKTGAGEQRTAGGTQAIKRIIRGIYETPSSEYGSEKRETLPLQIVGSVGDIEETWWNTALGSCLLQTAE